MLVMHFVAMFMIVVTIKIAMYILAIVTMMRAVSVFAFQKRGGKGTRRFEGVWEFTLKCRGGQEGMQT